MKFDGMDGKVEEVQISIRKNGRANYNDIYNNQINYEYVWK